MKKFSLWVYKHPFTVGLLTGGFAFFILVLTDMTSISICIVAITITIMLLGMRQNSQRYQTQIEEAKSILIPTITTPWPPNDELPEVGELPPKLANDPNENYERSERIKLGRFYKSSLNDWISIGDGYRRKKITVKRPVI